MIPATSAAARPQAVAANGQSDTCSVEPTELPRRVHVTAPGNVRGPQMRIRGDESEGEPASLAACIDPVDDGLDVAWSDQPGIVDTFAEDREVTYDVPAGWPCPISRRVKSV